MNKARFAAMVVAAVALFSLTALAAKPAAGERGRELSGVVNINTASVQQLTMLPGVGEAIAQRIVEHRAQRAFKSPEELRAVKGIGEQKYKKMSRFLSVSGPTTLAEAPKPQKKKEAAGHLAPAALDTLAYA